MGSLDRAAETATAAEAPLLEPMVTDVPPPVVAAPISAAAYAPQAQVEQPVEITLEPSFHAEEELVPPQPEPEPEILVDARIRPDTVESVASVARGDPPEPGIQVAPYHWRDLVDGDPPPLPHSGEGSYAVYHAIDVDQDLRITYATLVAIRTVRSRDGEPERHRLLADSRVTVQKRALLEVMDQARAHAEQKASRARALLGRKMARRRASVMRWPRGFTNVGFALLRAQARMGHASINGMRSLRRGLVEIPDALLSSTLRVQYHLGDRLARQSLVEGLKAPGTLTGEQRSVALFLTAALTIAAVLLLNSFFALVTPEYANTYRIMLAGATAQFIGLFGLPIIIEPLIISSIRPLGPWLTFTGFFAGKMLASWVMYLLGESLHHHLEKSAKGGFGKRMVDWLKRNVDKYGFTVLLLANALPLAPDQIMLVMAVSGVKFKTWMWGIGIGTVIRFAALIGGAILIGPEEIEHFFSNPFSALGGGH